MRLLDTIFELLKKFRQNRQKTTKSSRLLLRGGCFYPPKYCPDSDWGWCFDPPPNFEPRFFIQIMLKTKVLRWILYPYIHIYIFYSYHSFILSFILYPIRGTGVGEIHHPSIRISKIWCRWIDPPLVVIGTQKQFFANFKV